MFGCVYVCLCSCFFFICVLYVGVCVITRRNVKRFIHPTLNPLEIASIVVVVVFLFLYFNFIFTFLFYLFFITQTKNQEKYT